MCSVQKKKKNQKTYKETGKYSKEKSKLTETLLEKDLMVDMPDKNLKQFS